MAVAIRTGLGIVMSVRYLVAGEYKGFESDPEKPWNITDVSMTFPLGGPATTLTVGKTKETFAYEMVGDAAMEVRRGLGPHVAGSLRKDGRDRQRAYPAAVDLLRALAQVDRGGVRASSSRRTISVRDSERAKLPGRT